MLREPLSSPGAELVVMPTAPLLTSQNRAITARFCSLPPCRLVQGWSHWVLQCLCKILHLARSRRLTNGNTPTPTKTQQQACVFVLSSSALLYLPTVSPHLGLTVTISIWDPDSDLTLLSEKQHSCSTLLLSKSRASICVLLKLTGHSLPELPARACIAQLPTLPSPDSGWHLPWASFFSCSLHHGHV